MQSSRTTIVRGSIKVVGDGRQAMKVHYDSQADALYVALAEARVAGSEEVAPGVVLDLDASNDVIGIEVLGVRQRRPNADVTRLQFETL